MSPGPSPHPGPLTTSLVKTENEECKMALGYLRQFNEIHCVYRTLKVLCKYMLLSGNSLTFFICIQLSKTLPQFHPRQNFSFRSVLLILGPFAILFCHLFGRRDSLKKTCIFEEIAVLYWHVLTYWLYWHLVQPVVFRVSINLILQSHSNRSHFSDTCQKRREELEYWDWRNDTPNAIGHIIAPLHCTSN